MALLPLPFVLPLLLAAAPVVDARQGGTGTTAQTAPAAPAKAVWRAPAPAWSNASPLVLDDLVCATAEPTTVWCVDTATGAPRWQAEVTYGDTLPAADRAAWDTARARATTLRGEAEALQAAYANLRRELRRTPGDPALATRLQEVSQRLAVARAGSDDPSLHDTPGTREVIGWSAHPPTSDGERVFVLFGQGVVGAFARDGRRLWTVFTEPPPAPMRGYHLGTAAAPLVVDGLLIVPHGHLRALDPATGREVWEGPRYADFGTPAVARVGGLAVLLTPAGEIVRVRDGAVLQTGLDAPWFTGWHVAGSTAYVVGGQAGDVIAPDYAPTASAWTLTRAGDGVRATRAWSTRLPTRERFYTPPVADAALWAVGADGTPWRLALQGGAAEALPPLRLGTVYTSPLLTASGLLTGGEAGLLGVVQRAGLDPELRLEALRSTPVAAGGRWYVRTLDALWCLESR